jgi:hypothetical protein
MFGVVCTVSTAVFTVHDWVIDRQHARWPVTTATVRASSIELHHPFPNDGGGTVYYVDATVRLDVGADTATARIYSESVRVTNGTRVMRTWVDQHPPGTAIQVRYDPADPHHVELIDAGGLIFSRHTRHDVALVLGALLFSAVLYGAGRVVRSRGISTAG